MTKELIQVPGSLLVSPDLPASAKLIWMVAGLRPESDHAGTTWLSKNCGISRPTVLKGIAQLQSAGWDPNLAHASGSVTIPFPGVLLTNRRLGVHARVLYGFLLMTPGFSHPSGRFTHAELADAAQFSPNTVSKAVVELVQAEWIIRERANRLAPIRFELTFPGLSRGLNDLARAQRNLERAEFYGEGLMREYLSLLIDSDEYEDDASPGFLVNPRTDERLQLDRYYPPHVAFEFNGAQHYRPTEKYTIAQVIAQKERDYIKRGICVTRGITLVTIHDEDLTLKTMQQKVQNLFPLRDLTRHELLIDYLSLECRDYRERVSRF